MVKFLAKTRSSEPDAFLAEVRSLLGELLAGVDEVGRGPLAGAVFAAAVILDPARPIEGLADSKKLTAKRREQLFEVICERATCWAIAKASVSYWSGAATASSSRPSRSRASPRLWRVTASPAPSPASR